MHVRKFCKSGIVDKGPDQETPRRLRSPPSMQRWRSKKAELDVQRPEPNTTHLPDLDVPIRKVLLRAFRTSVYEPHLQLPLPFACTLPRGVKESLGWSFTKAW
ncbi:MAG: hypothetical protein KDC03_23585, partial [Flavobacteriales bacterium]|nr:hypothetical protein [Flavobacteriales bacterium]